MSSNHILFGLPFAFVPLIFPSSITNAFLPPLPLNTCPATASFCRAISIELLRSRRHVKNSIDWVILIWAENRLSTTVRVTNIPAWFLLRSNHNDYLALTATDNTRLSHADRLDMTCTLAYIMSRHMKSLMRDAIQYVTVARRLMLYIIHDNVSNKQLHDLGIFVTISHCSHSLEYRRIVMHESKYCSMRFNRVLVETIHPAIGQSFIAPNWQPLQ